LKHNNRTDTVLAGIKNSPGIRHLELVRTTGIPNSTISYYIKKLEKNKQISVQKSSKSCRFFVPELSEIQRRVIVMLRYKNTRIILLALKKNEMPFSSLVKQLEKHPSTISINLKKLVNSDLVEKIGRDKFAIKNKDDIKRTINKFESKTLLFVSISWYGIFQNCTNFVLFDFGVII
jgi:predicted transcriptional regulator